MHFQLRGSTTLAVGKRPNFGNIIKEMENFFIGSL